MAMQPLRQLTFFLLFALAGVCTQPPNLASSKHLAEPAVTAREIIQRFNQHESGMPSAQAYLDAAVVLQSLPFHQAVKALDQLANAADYSHDLTGLPKLDEGHVFVLCRMLFKAKPGGEFRKPARGGESLFIPTPPAGWPLNPIAIIDGAPFVLPMSILIAGARGESPRTYLSYCVANCEWNDFRYTRKGQQELQQALDGLLALLEHETPLSDYAKQAFARQIQ